MENDRLIFDDEFVNKEMKESGLLHCLPVPVFQIQDQVCFIHLTVQEFLAAKYIVETKEPNDIKEFISSHVEHGKWHLVLQFLAGLLGKKIELFEEYRSCVLAFGEHLHPKTEIEGEDIVYEALHNVMLMKCLRETKNEHIAKEIATASALKRVTKMYISGASLLSSDCAAILFVCMHLNLLKHLHVDQIANIDSVLEITKLLHHRCIEALDFPMCTISVVQEVLKHVLCAVTASECRINHEHSKFAHLSLTWNKITDNDISILSEFLENTCGVCLKSLDLSSNEITSVGISRFCDVLGHEAYNQLEVLNLGWNDIGDDGISILCSALEKNQHRLRELHVRQCAVTCRGTSWLGQVFRDRNCEITHLDVSRNSLGDKGVRILCSSFRKGNCELNIFDVSSNGLTHGCVSDLRGVLKDKKCKLIDLSLSGNDIGDEGVAMLFDSLKVKQCSLTKLDLSRCSLTKKCMASLCEALGDKHCGLTNLTLEQNYVRDEGIQMLFDALKVKQCRLTKLNLSRCSLTKKCMTSLCEALGNVNCRLTNLILHHNDIGDEGVEMLCCALEMEQCKLVALNLKHCSLTDECIPSLCKSLRTVRGKLTELWLFSILPQTELFSNKFTCEGSRLIKDAQESEHCRARGLRIF